MKIIRKLLLLAVLITIAAPVVGLADDPTPGCWPCTPTGK